MAFYVIAGQSDCPHFIHAVQIANYLYERLPNFSVYKISKNVEEYFTWLKEINTARQWHHQGSPIIWKEISMKGGHPHLIGGLSEFWEYIYDYYGLQTNLTKADIEALQYENKMLAQEEKLAHAERLKLSVNISITGAYNPYLCFLLYQILSYKNPNTSLDKEHMLFRLYEADLDLPKEDYLNDIINEANNTFFGDHEESELKKIYMVHSMEAALIDCDILFIFNEYVQRPEETDDHFHLRNIMEFGYIADQINIYAKRVLKVIVVPNTLSCLNATTLVHKCTTIKLTNIVAVTSDLGLPALNIVAQNSPGKIIDMCGPPIWGFIGINEFIDIRNAVIGVEYVKPYVRAIKDIQDSTLCKGEILKELRLLSYLVNVDIDMGEELQSWRTKLVNTTQQPNVFSKVRAIISLLECWFPAGVNDNIISLGVCSNGTFGIPSGIVFSQPVKYNKDTGTFSPYANVPMNENTKAKVSQMIAEASEIVEDKL